MKFLSLLLILFYTNSLFAFVSAGSSFTSGSLSVTPIVGYESTQKFYPTPHTHNTFYYGVGLTYGPQFFSLELQLIQANSTETFFGDPDGYERVEEEAIKASLGIRTNIPISSFLGFYLRGGFQAKKSDMTITQSGVTTSTTGSVYFDPSFGTGLNLAF